MKELLEDSVRSAGDVLMGYYGGKLEIAQKERPSSIVTQADTAAESCILQRIRARFPTHGIVAEESGWQKGSAPYTWIIDPLDGTSNFAAALPWFGVMVAVLEGETPCLAAMYLPVTHTLYLAERGQGVRRDGELVHVSSETRLANALCAYSLDSSRALNQTREEVRTLTRLVSRARGVRSTNCLLDFCYAIDGRLGGAICRSGKIWDVAPACLMFPEAGGLMTDIDGRELRFQPTKETHQTDYTVVGANPVLHRELIELASGV